MLATKNFSRVRNQMENFMDVQILTRSAEAVRPPGWLASWLAALPWEKAAE